MKRTAKFILGLVIFGSALAFCALLYVTRPVAEKKVDEIRLPGVEVLPVEFETVRFEIPSQGIVQATSRASLAAEVAGKVVMVSEKFDPGFRVEKDEILLQIEDSDYKAALANAKASLTEAEAANATEEARAEQAKRDFRRLGSGSATDLAMRKPQLASAAARVESARAAVAKAENDVARTAIRAPFAAVLASTMVDLGSYLAPGTPVAEVFSTGPYEVRLPLSVDEMPFLEDGGGVVEIRATAGGATQSWTGKIVRTEGEIDRMSRSAYVVVQIAVADGARSVALQPGLFIEASLPGREIPNLAKIPFSAFLNLDEIAVVDPDDKLRFREVTIVYREGNDVYISDGVDPGERVCLTELPGMIEGITVKPISATGEEVEPDNLTVKP